MNLIYKKWILIWVVPVIFLGGLAGLSAAAEQSELEKFIRARIDIGEAMTRYMQEQRPMERSMEELRQMEGEINSMVADILASYDLTIEEYRERSPKVFEDEAEVKRFLDAHPDLKKRYEVLPLHQSGRPPGRPPRNE
jgi:predicted  nucleic acid-binding Zn-ribbon protein